jgi:hypothetical protein
MELDPHIWGSLWERVDGAGSLQRELDVELGRSHPLAGLAPRILGRCRSCDDVVVMLGDDPILLEVAVIHLTWRGAPESEGWPYFERMSTQGFIARFLRSGEHL